MMDWDLMTEYIQNAMQAVEKAHDAANGLRENTNRETLDQFRRQMAELTDHLSKLQNVLEHQDTFVLEELADRLSALMSGKRPEYRRTPRMEATKAD
jgi:hypothetical protein